jgi:GT2 family glycosyltransferase
MNDITVIIPYEAGRRLARAYNNAMRKAQTEWVLFLDWDVFNCCPYWFDMCQYAVAAVRGRKVGWITCVTNAIGAPQQRAPGAPKGHDVAEHMAYAKSLFHQHSSVDARGVLQSTEIRRIPGALSGFFILTSKSAWRDSGGFDESRTKLMGVDNRYSRAVCKAGYTLASMPGLYFYHIYRHKRLIWKAKGSGWYGAKEEGEGQK